MKKDEKIDKIMISDDARQFMDIAVYHSLCWIPLHNNPAELALHEPVIKRKISNGTRSEDGKTAWENIMSLLDTCRKLCVSFFDYVKDIFSGKHAMTRLAQLISQSASLKSTFY